MYDIRTFNSEDIIEGNQLFHDLYIFSEKAYNEGKADVKENMNVINWQKDTHTLLHITIIQKRFRTGSGLIACAYFEDEIIALNAGNAADFAFKDVFLCGSRTYTLKEHRFKTIHFNHLFPIHFKYAKDNGFKQCWFTFNEYRRGLMDGMKKGVGAGQHWGKQFQKDFADLIYLDDLYNINYALQYVAIKKIDPNYKFDFKQIQIKND